MDEKSSGIREFGSVSPVLSFLVLALGVAKIPIAFPTPRGTAMGIPIFFCPSSSRRRSADLLPTGFELNFCLAARFAAQKELTKTEYFRLDPFKSQW